MAKRIFELSRELGVTSKIVLEKCRAEGIEVKNHMSTVKVGLAATISEWFSETSAGGSAVEITEHVDIDAARKEAEKVIRKRKKALPEEPPAKEEPLAEPDQVVAEAPNTEADAPSTVAVEEVTEVPEPPAEVVEAAAEIAVVEAVAETAAEVQAEAPPPEAPAEAQGDAPEEDQAPPAGEPEEAPPEKIKPMGPRVVPIPAVMKGPRVVRVEAPDIMPAPRPRRRPGPGPGGDSPSTAAPRRFKPTGDAGATAAGQDQRRGAGAGAGAGRRSPRRRGAEGDNKKVSAPVRKRKREIRQQDLQERTARLAAAVGGGMRRHRASEGGRKGLAQSGPAVKIGLIEVEEPLTIKNISAATGIRSNVLIKKLMETGVLATVNQIVDLEVVQTIMGDFEIELSFKRAKTAEEELAESIAEREKGETAPRAPVVTFLGHVDHGKTSLLDYIRKTGVASGEAGGITQHIGAYRFDNEGKHVVFLDTPGHEAFTAMRARGANMTDVVVLVVAADDGVMPQTIEAISHAKAAEVPIVVALNKCELPNANVNRAMGQLAEHGLNPREWGGETEVIQTDAISGTGVEALVETLSLEAELLEIEAEVDVPASGFVIESQMRPGLGAVASLLVLNGTLRIGDIVLGGHSYGRVRQMTDSNGQSITEAPPATPVEISGLSEICQAGDRFFVAPSIERARSAAEDRGQRARVATLGTGQQATLEGLFSQIQADQVSEVKLILKADVQGSIEALVGSLEKLATEEVKANILHSAVGGITTSDVTLAEASQAVIIGFNVVADGAARQLADAKGVEIRLYRVIYEIIDDVRAFMEEGLAPDVSEETLGRAEVRQTFKVSRIGTVAGCIVVDGVVGRTAKVRITRNSVVIEDERELDSLKRFKDDAKEVRSGMECGLKLAGYDDIKVGDILEFYKRVETARTLG